MRDPAERLRDILDAIANIERYADRGRQAFESDELIQNWFVRHLQIIGEAAYALPKELRDQRPDIPWTEMMAELHALRACQAIRDGHIRIDDAIKQQAESRA